MPEDFVIKRGGPGTLTGILPATALPIGTPLMVGSMDADTGAKTFVVAEGRADGFLTRASRVGPGLTDAELVDQSFGLPLTETPFEAGKPASIEMAQALEVEGSSYIKGASTGAITSGTAAETKLSFEAGLFYVAQTGDTVSYRLVKQMTPQNGGFARIYVEKIDGYIA